MNEKAVRLILVVDGDDAARQLLCQVLEQRGFAWLSAHNGAAALQQVRAHGPALALVLLDMTLPDMPGEQVFEALLRLQPDLYFLLLTGGGDGDALLRMARLGEFEVLNKPCRLFVMVGRIDALLARHPHQPPSPSLAARHQRDHQRPPDAKRNAIHRQPRGSTHPRPAAVKQD